MTDFQKPEASGVAAALSKTYAQHPLSAVVEKLTPAEYQALKDSIENIGPTTTAVLAEGKVLWGWYTYQACMELAMPCPVHELASHIEPQDYLDAQNIGRKSATGTQRIPLDRLKASNQPRPIDPADVDKLAASIKQLGLIQPITVRAALVMGNTAKDGFQIVAGHHRVAAARALGWTEIKAIVVERENRLECELIEIDENLIRTELTAAQRAHYTARRKEIWEALQPYVPPEVWQDDAETEVGKVCPPQFAGQLGGARPQTKGFAAATADLTGESKRAINLNIARGEALGNDALRVVGTSLDKGVELDALTKLPEPARKELIERAAAGEKVTARAVVVVPPPKSSTPDPWDVPAGENTLPEGMTEEDFGPSAEEIAMFEAQEKAERELVAKMLAEDDKLAALYEETKKLKAQVAHLERRNIEMMNRTHAVEQLLKKRTRENDRLRKELDTLKGGVK